MARKALLFAIIAAIVFMTGCSIFEPTSSSKDGTTVSGDTIGTEETTASEQTADETNSAGNQETSSTLENTQNTGAGSEKTVLMNLYFTNDDNSAVPTEKREVTVKNGAIMRAAIQALLEGPKGSGLKKAIPEGTRLLGIKRSGNTGVVDFSGEFAAANGLAGIVARISVVNTLIDLPGSAETKILKVRILIEGKDLIGPSGEAFGEMEKAALDKNGFPIPGEARKVTVYFGNSNADKVVPEVREITLNSGEKLEAAVFSELAKGPSQKGHYPVVPQGTELLSVETRSGICYLNLSREFVDNNHSGTAGESMTVNSIVNSLTEIKGVQKVQFLIEGKKEPYYLHMVFDEPIGRNAGIIGK